MSMKTAISLPNGTFEAVDQAAKRLGMSRSEFFARSAERFIGETERTSVTSRINASLERASDDDSEFATASGRQTLAFNDEAW